MSRNTRIRRHSYIPSGKKGPRRYKPKYQQYANTAEKEAGLTRNRKAVLCLNGVLLLLPWSLLYTLGALV